MLDHNIMEFINEDYHMDQYLCEDMIETWYVTFSFKGSRQGTLRLHYWRIYG